MPLSVQCFRHLEAVGGSVDVRIVELEDSLQSDNENWKRLDSERLVGGLEASLVTYKEAPVPRGEEDNVRSKHKISKSHECPQISKCLSKAICYPEASDLIGKTFETLKYGSGT